MRYLILLAFLPYLKISPLASDTQPHFLIAFVVTLMLWAVIKKRLPIHYFTLLISICMFPVGLALNAGPAIIPLVIAPIAIDFFSSRPGKDFIWAAKVAIVVYYIGIALNIISPNILEMFVTNFRTSPLRGFNSFTSEPSYLGLVGLCLTAILIALKAPRKWGGGAIVLVFLSGSATAIAPLFVYLALLFLRGKMLILFPLFLWAAWLLISYIATTDTRLGSLVYTFLNSPQLIFLDTSLSNRIIRGFGPIIAAFRDFFIPHDFSSSVKVSFDFLSPLADDTIERLSSLATIFLYGLGWLSFPLVIAYIKAACISLPLYFLVVFFSVANITFATPYLWIFLSIPILVKRQRLQHRCISSAG